MPFEGLDVRPTGRIGGQVNRLSSQVVVDSAVSPIVVQPTTYAKLEIRRDRDVAPPCNRGASGPVMTFRRAEQRRRIDEYPSWRSIQGSAGRPGTAGSRIIAAGARSSRHSCKVRVRGRRATRRKHDPSYHRTSASGCCQSREASRESAIACDGESLTWSSCDAFRYAAAANARSITCSPSNE